MLGKIEMANCSKGGWEEDLHYFLIFKAAEGRSERTIRDYQGHVRRFFKRFPNSFQPGTIIRQSVLAYLSDSVKPATYNLRYTNLKVFFEWCGEEGYLPKDFNPFRGLKKKKAEARIVRIPKDVLAT
jgi:integrase